MLILTLIGTIACQANLAESSASIATAAHYDIAGMVSATPWQVVLYSVAVYHCSLTRFVRFATSKRAFPCCRTWKL